MGEAREGLGRDAELGTPPNPSQPRVSLRVLVRPDHVAAEGAGTARYHVAA